MHGQKSWGINPEVESGIQTNRQKNVAHLRNLFFFGWVDFGWMPVAFFLHWVTPWWIRCVNRCTRPPLDTKVSWKTLGTFVECGFTHPTWWLYVLHVLHVRHALWQNVVSELSPSFSWCTFRQNNKTKNIPICAEETLLNTILRLGFAELALRIQQQIDNFWWDGNHRFMKKGGLWLGWMVVMQCHKLWHCFTMLYHH